MPDENAPAPVPAATPAVDPSKPTTDAKPEPTSDAWAKVTRIEKNAQRANEKAFAERKAAKEDRAAAEKARTDATAAASAIKGDAAKALEAVGGLDGYNRITKHLLAARTAARAEHKPQPTETDVAKMVAAEIERRDAVKAKSEAEAKSRGETEAKATADKFFASVTRDAQKMLDADPAKYEQLAHMLKRAGAPGLDAAMRYAQQRLTAAEPWKIGERTARGETSLDAVLEMLDAEAEETAEAALSPKIRARLAGQESAATGGAKKSETGGPSTLTPRLSQESALPSRPASTSDHGSPLKRRQDQEKADIERAIADVAKVFQKA